MSEKKSMQQAIDLLTEAAEILGTIVNNREEMWESRSERWHESDKGVDYCDVTSQLENAIAEVEAASTTVEEALDA